MFNISNDQTVAIDAEWDSSRELLLSVQFASLSGKNLIVLNSFITDQLTSEQFQSLKTRVTEWASDSKHCPVLWLPISDALNLFECYQDYFGLEPGEYVLRMFYSPKDLWMGLGWDSTVERFRQGLSKDPKVKRSGFTQKRNIKGEKVKVGRNRITLQDMKGWSPGSLASFAASVGYEMQAKDGMDQYKSHMLDGLLEDTETFLNYSLGDVTDLHEIHKRFMHSTNEEVIKGILGVDLEGDLPQTTGALVAKTFKQWLGTRATNKDAFNFTLHKLGVLDTNAPGYDSARKTLARLVKNVRTSEAATRVTEELHKISFCFRSLGYSQTSVSELARETTTLAFGALVQGGRCSNEWPFAYTVGIGADIDLKSCYGTALMDFTYPIGLPSTDAYTENQERPTLGQWLRTNEPELVDGLWTVTVGGSLSFRQDLIFSKLTTLSQINRNAFGVDWDKETPSEGDREDDHSHIPGEFCLIRKEIMNGIITSDILKLIRAVATAKELSELMGLEVVTAIYFKKSDRIATADEWVERVLADKGSRNTVKGNARAIVDTRTKAWVGIPISDFIGPLVSARNEVKKLKKRLTGDDATELAQVTAKDAALKLFVNTLYGVLASPYFPIGNTVVANNITARARLGAWMMNKSLWTLQSITDGGMYSPLTVPFLEAGKLPGFNVLSDRTGWVNYRNRKLGSLGGLNWEELIYKGMSKADISKLAGLLDETALTHINTFWGHYGLALPFNIEHKGENTFVKAAYWNKAHYAFELASPEANKGKERIYKIRGAKEYKDDLKRHPMFELLDNILDGSDVFPQDLEYDHFFLQSISKWGIQDKALQRRDSSEEAVRPGESIIERRVASFNNVHVPVDTVAEFQKRSGRKRERFEKGQKVRIQLFERFASEGIQRVHQAIVEDCLDHRQKTRKAS
jgi:hypothetical protein